MAVDIAGLLSRKYDILQENADAQNRLSWAQSGLLGAQTQTEPMEASARAEAARGAGAAGRGQGALALANAAQVPGLAQSEEQERSAQGNDLMAHAWMTHIMGTGDPNLTGGANQRWFNDNGQAPLGQLPTYQAPGRQLPGNSNVIGGASPGFGTTMNGTSAIRTFDQPVPDQGQGTKFSFDTGTSQVPGDGSPKVDSVSAKLAPGEAVLNAAAAEHLGRSTIDFLNAIGAHKMGLTVGTGSGEAPDKSSPAKGSKKDSGVEVSNQTGDPPGYATGTDNVSGQPPAPGQTITSGTWGQAPNIRQLTGITGVPRPTPPAKPPAYKAGTSNVQKTAAQKSDGTKSKSKASSASAGKGTASPTLPPPGVMQALLAMGGGGAGMPPPAARPMPMPMPQVAR